MWAFCGVPGRRGPLPPMGRALQVSWSLGDGAGETKPDFSQAKVRPPGWDHSPTQAGTAQRASSPPPPVTSCLSLRHFAASGSHGRPSAPRGPPPAFPGGRRCCFPRGLTQSSLQRLPPRPGRLPSAFLAGWACLILPGCTCGPHLQGAPRWGGEIRGVAVGTGFKRFHLRM